MIQAFEINSTTFPAAKITGIPQLVNLGLPIATAVASIIFLVTLLYAGFNIITHGDNPEALKKAYSTMVMAVVGLLIVISSFLAVKLLGVVTKAF